MNDYYTPNNNNNEFFYLFIFMQTSMSVLKVYQTAQEKLHVSILVVVITVTVQLDIMEMEYGTESAVLVS